MIAGPAMLSAALEEVGMPVEEAVPVPPDIAIPTAPVLPGSCTAAYFVIENEPASVRNHGYYIVLFPRRHRVALSCKPVFGFQRR